MFEQHFASFKWQKLPVIVELEKQSMTRNLDLIVFVGPRVGHLTDLVLPGEGIFESFFARRGDI